MDSSQQRTCYTQSIWNNVRDLGCCNCSQSRYSITDVKNRAVWISDTCVHLRTCRTDVSWTNLNYAKYISPVNKAIIGNYRGTRLFQMYLYCKGLPVWYTGGHSCGPWGLLGAGVHLLGDPCSSCVHNCGLSSSEKWGGFDIIICSEKLIACYQLHPPEWFVLIPLVQFWAELRNRSSF